MPIRPENRAKYPPDWPTISIEARSRAQNRCEWCGVQNRAWGYRRACGEFVALRGIGDLVAAGYRRPPFALHVDGVVRNVIAIVLTVAHLNHDPADCRPENLAALCQRCHLRYDAPAKRAARAKREAAGTGDLFASEEAKA